MLNYSGGPGYDVKFPGCLHPNECSRLDAERHRPVKTSHTKSHVTDGQSLYPCMHGHFRLEQLSLHRNDDDDYYYIKIIIKIMYIDDHNIKKHRYYVKM